MKLFMLMPCRMSLNRGIVVLGHRVTWGTRHGAAGRVGRQTVRRRVGRQTATATANQRRAGDGHGDARTATATRARPRRREHARTNQADSSSAMPRPSPTRPRAAHASVGERVAGTRGWCGTAWCCPSPRRLACRANASGTWDVGGTQRWGDARGTGAAVAALGRGRGRGRSGGCAGARVCDAAACHALPALRDHSQAEALQREGDIGGCQVLVLARGERGGARRLLGRPSRAGLLRRAGWGY